jgi:hypothetical protein
VIIKTLAKRREDRFEDCHQLNQSYQAALAGKKMPEFDLPPPAPTMSVARREVPTIAEAMVEAPDLPKRRMAWWLIPTVILALIMVGVFAFPTLSGLMGWSTPTSSPVTQAPPTATSFVIIGSTPSEPAISATPVIPLTAASCPGIALHPPTTEGNTVRWMVDNGSEATVEIIGLQLEGWPLGNGGLEQFSMNDQLLWEGEYKAGQQVELAGAGDLLVGTSTPAIFVFKFHWGAAAAGYQLRVVFDAGCTLQGSW